MSQHICMEHLQSNLMKFIRNTDTFCYLLFCSLSYSTMHEQHQARIRVVERLCEHEENIPIDRKKCFRKVNHWWCRYRWCWCWWWWFLSICWLCTLFSSSLSTCIIEILIVCLLYQQIKNQTTPARSQQIYILIPKCAPHQSIQMKWMREITGWSQKPYVFLLTNDYFPFFPSRYLYGYRWWWLNRKIFYIHAF